MEHKFQYESIKIYLIAVPANHDLDKPLKVKIKISNATDRNDEVMNEIHVSKRHQDSDLTHSKTVTKVEQSHPVVQMIDELIRTSSRLRTIFQDPAREFTLSKMELTVLTAVVIAERPPTVPQIGRSIGCARQVIQRAANRLIDINLIYVMENPDHKTAKLLAPTDEGVRIKSEIDQNAIRSADEILGVIDVRKCEKLTKDLRALRKEFENFIKRRE